jgi:hypothetical protein
VNDNGRVLELVAERADEKLLPDPATVRAAGDRRTHRTRGLIAVATAAIVAAAVAVGAAASGGSDSTPPPADHHAPRPTLGGARPWPDFDRPPHAPTPPAGVQPQRVLDGVGIPSPVTARAVATAGGRYVAIGTREINGGDDAQPIAWSSGDGLHWTEVHPWPQPYGRPAAIAGTDQGFVVLANLTVAAHGSGWPRPYVLRSTDGRSWTASVLPVPREYRGDLNLGLLLKTGQTLVAVAGHNAAPGVLVWVSRDGGASWSIQADDYFGILWYGGDDVCAARQDGDDLVLAVAHPSLHEPSDHYRATEWRSTDGSHWTQVSVQPTHKRPAERFCGRQGTVSWWAVGSRAVVRVTAQGRLESWPRDATGD